MCFLEDSVHSRYLIWDKFGIQISWDSKKGTQDCPAYDVPFLDRPWQLLTISSSLHGE